MGIEIQIIQSPGLKSNPHGSHAFYTLTAENRLMMFSVHDEVAVAYCKWNRKEK